MASFTYVAADRQGGTQRGTISAANSHEAAEIIRGKGLVPVNINAVGGGASRGLSVRTTAPSGEAQQSRLAAGGRIAAKDLSIFTSQLGTMLNAGLSITKVLDIQSKQLSNKKLLAMTDDLKKNVEAGLPCPPLWRSIRGCSAPCTPHGALR